MGKRSQSKSNRRTRDERIAHRLSRTSDIAEHRTEFEKPVTAFTDMRKFDTYKRKQN